MCQLANSGLLGGMTLEEAMSEKMLFYQDYYTVLGSEIMSKAGHPSPCWIMCHSMVPDCLKGVARVVDLQIALLLQ